MSTTTTAPGSAFTRKRIARIGAGVASAGVIAGFSLAGAAPAMAYTDTDCTLANTAAIGLGDDGGDIQDLLDDATLPVICIDGTFVLASGLTYDRSVTIHGLPGATLDGSGFVKILEDLDNQNNTLTIESLHLTGGEAVADSGGAIDSGYSVIVHDSVFDNNDANEAGGAISAYTVDIYDSLFENNSAFLGGAVIGEQYVGSANSTFQHNDASELGGAIISYGFTNINSSTFFDNDGYEGGAIFSATEDSPGSAYVENSTFVENTAEYGGAISTTGGTVLQSTFQNNTADTAGQAIELFNDDDADPSSLLIRGNLFTGTTTTDPYLVVGENTEYADLGGNLFSTAEATESALITPDPSTAFNVAPAALYVTGALGDNGGPTQTVALSATSPAIDAVPAGAPAVTDDQRGVARSDLSDAGAFEYVPGTEPALAATGLVPAGWMGGLAALLLAAGAVTVGITRRSLRLR